MIPILPLTYAIANSKLRRCPCADAIRTANEGNLFVSWVAGVLP